MKRLAIWGALALCWLGLWSMGRMAARVRAESAKLVLVLAPAGVDAALSEVTARVRGELTAAGFRVEMREPPTGLTPLRAVEHAGVELGPSAVLWVVAASSHSEQAPNLEIWLSDRLLGKVSMARLPGSSGRPTTPSSLAVLAVELLRARLAELRVTPVAAEPVAVADSWEEQSSEPAAPVAVAASQVEPTKPDREPGRTPRKLWFGLSAGLGVLLGSGNLDPLFAPSLNCVLGFGEPGPDALPLAVDLRLGAVGFGPSEQLERDQGSAQVGQALGELSAALRLVTHVPVEPWLSLGAGVYTLGVQGSASEPYMGHDQRFWSALGSLGLGLRSRPWAHLTLSASAELLGTLTRATVRIDDQTVARAAGGMWLMRAELMGVF
jgi:hypothetical protein